MSLFHKSIESIDELALNSLVSEKIAESRLIEYKRIEGKLDLSSERQESKPFSPKVEFLLDVCQFANAEGGDLIYGIEQDRNGAASKITGFVEDNPDQLERRINDIILSGIKPRIRHELKWIDLTDKENKVLLIRIFPSWNPPHQVSHEYPLFCTRSFRQRIWLDVDTLRHAYLGSETIAERIRQFRFKRIDEILAGRTPRPTLGVQPYINHSAGRYVPIVLHCLPLVSFTQRIDLDLTKFNSERGKIDELGSIFYNRKIGDSGTTFSLDGFAMHAGGFGNSEFPDKAYVNIFHNGSVEIYLALLASNHNGGHLTLVKFTPKLNELFDWVMRLFTQNSETPPPYYIFFSMLNCSGIALLGPDRYGGENKYRPTMPFNRDHIILPDELITEMPLNPKECLYPFYHHLWQAVDFSEAPREWLD